MSLFSDYVTLNVQQKCHLDLSECFSIIGLTQNGRREGIPTKSSRSSFVIC